MATTKSTPGSDATATLSGDVSGSTTVSPGPSKHSATGRPGPRLSHHKGRAAWFRARVSWPLRDASAFALAAARNKADRKLASLPGAKWTLAGPTNIGGRCTALVCQPADPNIVWVGCAGGGVWKSTDAGGSWRQSWPASAPLQIGSLALDPSDAQVVYCGTGEANMSADSYPGDGVYGSSNGGKTWRRLASVAKNAVPPRIGVIAVDPFDPKHLLLGGIGFGRLSATHDAGGLYQSKDRGASWKRLNPVLTGNHWCHSIVFDPATSGRIFATITAQGADSGIYRSDDAGASWTHLVKGLPPSDRMGRASLALAPSNPKVIYALVADEHSDNADLALGVFKTVNGGASWINVAGSHFRSEGQIGYGNAIAVHPRDPKQVICGGVDLHVTTDGGATWRRTSRWNARRGASNYAHADHHALVLPAASPGRVYSANDGGVDLSDDMGGNWQNRSNGLSVTMFYDVDVAQTDPRVFGGGAQDNGTLVTNAADASGFFELLGGDGGWMVVDPREAGHIYASYQFGGMYCFRNGTSRDVTPPFKPAESYGIWMVYITMDPNDSNCVYTGNHRLYRTRNDGRSWKEASPVFDSSPISAIEVALANSNTLYVGTENGALFRSLDAGVTWSADLRNGVLPGVAVTRIATHPKDAKDVYVTVANSGNSHVFRSRDGGLSWVDIDAGALPDAPHHAVLVRPDAPGEVYVCSDAGVYVSSDGGTKWLNATGNLPKAMVIDIVYQVATKTLVAATYGRSIWQLKLP